MQHEEKAGVLRSGKRRVSEAGATAEHRQEQLTTHRCGDPGGTKSYRHRAGFATVDFHGCVSIGLWKLGASRKILSENTANFN